MQKGNPLSSKMNLFPNGYLNKKKKTYRHNTTWTTHKYMTANVNRHLLKTSVLFRNTMAKGSNVQIICPILMIRWKLVIIAYAQMLL